MHSPNMQALLKHVLHAGHHSHLAAEAQPGQCWEGCQDVCGGAEVHGGGVAACSCLPCQVAALGAGAEAAAPGAGPRQAINHGSHRT